MTAFFFTSGLALYFKPVKVKSFFRHSENILVKKLIQKKYD